jgi:acyl carrier protein phosphodiesterase
MNWLAHLHLSEPTVEFRLGNVIADFVKGEARQQLPPQVKRGTDCHLFIDAFTDAHPIFLRSRARISPKNRRFGSILIDIFYDHFLSAQWCNYSSVPLDGFVTEVYASFLGYTQHKHSDVPQARDFVQHMVAGDWLREYVTVDGVARTLARVSRRLSRPNLLVPMLDELKANYDDLRDDFAAFYPTLQGATLQWQMEHS